MFNRKNAGRALVGCVAGLLVASGLVWTTGFTAESVAAQSLPEQRDGSTIFEIRGGPGRGGFFGFGQRMHRGFGARAGSSQSSLLANALGVTPVELQEAQQNARNILLDQAVAAGVVTAEQATQLKEGERPSGSVAALRTYLADADQDAALAQALGITGEALTAAKGTMVQKGVEAGLITQERGNQMLLTEKIRAATQAAVEQAINEAVAEGLITQEEANRMLQNRDFDKGFGSGFHRGGFGPGRGEQSREGRSFFGGPDSTPETAPAPSDALFGNL